MPSIISKFVEVCIFKFVRDRSWFLMLHRAKDERVYPNIWQFVSGAIEENELAKETALRELKEETGLSPTAFWVVPYVNIFYDATYDSVNLDPVFAVQVEPGSEPQLSGEHDEYKWCGLDEALRLLTWPGQRRALQLVHEYIVRDRDAASHSKIV